MQLTNAQLEDLRQAILKAFPGVAGSASVIIALESVDVDLTRYGNPLTPLFFLLQVALQDINARGRIVDVIGAVRRANPADASLTELEGRWLRTSAASERSRLEGMVLDGLNYQAAPEWLDRVRAACGSVCRVERASDGKSLGTGFLVASDLVLTNYHVLYSSTSKTPIPVQLRFDATTQGGGQIVLPDSAKQQPVVESPPGGSEWGGSGDPSSTELDFAVIRLAEGPGSPSHPAGAKRAHLEIDTTAIAVSNDRPLLLLEHPLGAPLQICLGSITGANPGGTRVHHNATTQRGSSGSPCLSMDLKVVALHNGGAGSQHNTAIPMLAVKTALAERSIVVD
jgi:S1-C subfamily serine protease